MIASRRPRAHGRHAATVTTMTSLVIAAIASCNLPERAPAPVESPDDATTENAFAWHISGRAQYDVVGPATIRAELVCTGPRATPPQSWGGEWLEPLVWLSGAQGHRRARANASRMTLRSRPEQRSDWVGAGHVLYRFEMDVRRLFGRLEPGGYEVSVSMANERKDPGGTLWRGPETCCGQFKFEVVNLAAGGFIERETPDPAEQGGIVLELHEAGDADGNGLEELGPATVLNRSDRILYFSALQRYEPEDLPYHVEGIWESYEMDAGWVPFPKGERATYYLTPEVEPGGRHDLLFLAAPNDDGWYRVKLDCYLLSPDGESSTRFLAVSSPSKIDNYRFPPYSGFRIR